MHNSQVRSLPGSIGNTTTSVAWSHTQWQHGYFRNTATQPQWQHVVKKYIYIGLSTQGITPSYFDSRATLPYRSSSIASSIIKPNGTIRPHWKKLITQRRTIVGYCSSTTPWATLSYVSYSHFAFSNSRLQR